MKRVRLRILPLVVIALAILGFAVQARAFLLGAANTNSAIVPAFYVATNGRDSNPGTLAQPFATIAKAQVSMQASSTKITYIRAGTYAPSAGSGCGNPDAVELGGSDAGEI